MKPFFNNFENKGFRDFVWRAWQDQLLYYINNPTSRQVICVIGEKGNEGKTFFQQQIEEQYGTAKVCTMPAKERSIDILHVMRKEVDTTTNVFLFEANTGKN